jgi:hypothetical protein
MAVAMTDLWSNHLTVLQDRRRQLIFHKSHGRNLKWLICATYFRSSFKMKTLCHIIIGPHGPIAKHRGAEPKHFQLIQSYRICGSCKWEIVQESNTAIVKCRIHVERCATLLTAHVNQGTHGDAHQVLADPQIKHFKKP